MVVIVVLVTVLLDFKQSAASSHYASQGTKLPLLYSIVRVKPASFSMSEAVEKSCISLNCSRNFLFTVESHVPNWETGLLGN